MTPGKALTILAPLLGLLLAVALAGCAGSSSNASPPASHPSTLIASPSTPVASSSASPSSLPASGDPCALASVSQAAAALGEAVGKAQPKPLAPGDTFNGVKGSTCQWVKPNTGSEGYGGSVGVGILAYPSAATAKRLFKSSTAGVVLGETLINLPPGLAPAESANMSILQNQGSPGGTRTALALLLAGNRELTVEISEPTSQHFSQTAFVTLVKQVAQAWH